MTADDASASIRVPPYLLTEGRTSPTVVLALESRVQRVVGGSLSSLAGTAMPEKAAILAACRMPTPVVEVAGRTRLPIQVTRILIGDLIDEGLVTVETGSTNINDRPDIQLLERVLSGLRENR